MDAISEHNNEVAGRFFRKIDWSAFWTALVVCFVVYFYTLAPTVTLEDSGELAVAGDWLGVPHPPGYPIWTMMAWVFTKVFAFVKFRGQPNPAWSIGLMSAVFGALTAGLTALLICRSGRDVLQHSKQISHDIDVKTENAICWVGGVVSSLLFCFTPIMWSQSVIVEVYSLNAFFLVLVMLLVYVWNCRPSNHLLYLIAFVFGLGLTNYQVLLLAALALAIAILLKDLELFRDFVIVAVPFAIVLVLMKRFDGLESKPNVDSIRDMLGVLFTKGALPAIVHPTHITCYVYLFLNGLLLTLAYFFLPRGKTVAITVLLAELGVSVYAYMPIVSDLRNPPMNWGYPRTWEGFKHAISRGQYERISPSDIFSIRFIHQIGTYLADLRLNFTLFVTLIAFLPFTVWRLKFSNRVFNAFSISAIMIAIALLALPLGRIAPLYKIPSLAIIMFLAVGAIAMPIQRFRVLVNDHLIAREARLWERVTTAIALSAGGLCYLALVTKKAIDITAPLRSDKPMASEQISGMVVELLLIPVLIVLPVLLVWGVNWLLSKREMFEITVDADSQKWMVSTLIAFATLSIGLIALANLKMDIQDTFIQRVKFISSHVLFSFWIGYGIIYLLALFDGMVREMRELTWLCLVLATALPVVPLLANVYNERLLYVYGGAEQNGHDFGWQFGNYQLRGAEAILEELSPDEEPLPNPVFPPAMGQEAIFFGGTDPGRFVPTYMIYSAAVRPDVYLITQNALADNTYMNVMRDLYGNDIWIPDVADSANAFSSYVRDIETGKRPMTAGIVKQDGRVQVSGVLGVMEINGILAKNIFDHNNYKHEFFVEESYVIRWMYPYLEPHGLIMKINKEKVPKLTQTMRNNDLDFWDWYVRRLSTDSKFVRDVVARKSFSKLRSAIAGLYSDRGFRREAEIAFNEARMLYPLSPEANFRLGEVYMRSRQYDKARDLMIEFNEMDPANKKSEDFLKQVDRVEQLHNRIMTMEKSGSEGKLNLGQIFELAELHRQSGNVGRHNSLLNDILGNKDLSPDVLFKIARSFGQVNRNDKMISALDRCLDSLPEKADPKAFLDIFQLYAKAGHASGMNKSLSLYVRRRPNDWRAWLDLATLRMQLGDEKGAGEALGVALRYGGPDAENKIQSNPHLKKLHSSRSSRARNLMGLGL